MSERPNDGHSDEIKRTAVYFFFLNFVVIMFAYALYDEGMPWGLATMAICMATSAMFALSAASSTFGVARGPKASLVAGFIGLVISLVSVIILMMQYVSERSS